HYNQLEGNIDFLTTMNFSVLYLHHNVFTGQFNIQETQLLSIVYLDISANFLTGSLPYNPYWERIYVYEAYNNLFSGTLPTFQFTDSMTYFVTAFNYLISTIPINFFNSANNLFFIGLSNNYLSGSLPTIIGNYPFINQIILNNNLFSSFLPSLENNTLLVALEIANNQFIGHLPISLLKNQYLQQLFLQNNHFSGSLSSFLNGTLQKRLVSIDVSANEFTGTLPIELFIDAPNLVSFAASSNCLEGSIPEVICQVTTLNSLSLDGLSTSSSCRKDLFPNIPGLNGFTLSHFIHGTIPNCLYEMPHLQLLHVSGNGLAGTIPNHLNFSSIFSYLALSHNSLTGTIPNEIQQRNWQDLDLSYNKLTGTLTSDFAILNGSASISLEVNRLAGKIPSSLQGMNSLAEVNVLSGNIFSCDSDGSDLPQSDPDVHNYSCGSDNANNVLYAWLVALIFFPLIILFLLKLSFAISISLKELIQHCLQQWSKWSTALTANEQRVNLTRLSIYFSEMRRGSLKLMLYCL
ncbi:MAG: hypothetical protein K2P99_01420, partial [Burkholderiales bacterium]|nr:hypothetical protein [Burkholderiales bacterium]